MSRCPRLAAVSVGWKASPGFRYLNAAANVFSPAAEAMRLFTEVESVMRHIRALSISMDRIIEGEYQKSMMS